MCLAYFNLAAVKFRFLALLLHSTQNTFRLSIIIAKFKQIIGDNMYRKIKTTQTPTTQTGKNFNLEKIIDGKVGK